MNNQRNESINKIDNCLNLMSLNLKRFFFLWFDQEVWMERWMINDLKSLDLEKNRCLGKKKFRTKKK